MTRHSPELGIVTQVMETEIFDSCLALRQVKSTLHVDQTSLRPWTWKDMLVGVWQSFQHCTDRLIDRNETIFAVLGDSNVNHPSRQVHVEPGEIENLALPHSGVNGHRNDLLYPFLTLKFLEQLSFFLGSQITHPAVVRAKLSHSTTRIAFDQFGIERQRENLR